MRIEIVVFAALAALASAAPQWPYRDAVAPYYYGYPGKTPYMYRSGDEDDERDETYNLARQDLKVASSDGGGSSVTVVEDDEKADGVRVVETGSAKPLKPVVQSANNQQQQEQQPAATSQAQQPLSTNNANNAQQQQSVGSGQPLTVQQAGQQPPAFPPARPPNRQRPDEDEEAEDEDSEEEDDEDAEDEEGDGDDDDDDDDDDEEEDEEDRKRNIAAQKEASSSEEPASATQPIVNQQEEPQASIPASEGSDEIVQEEPQPAVVVEQPQKLPSQSSVLSSKVKVNKNKQNAAAVAAVPVSAGKNKKKAVTSKVKPSSGAIEALVPGYVTDQGEVLVPVDTVTGSQPITIVPDPFSPPSRIVAGPRPIPQSAVPNTPSRQVPYWYRSSPAINPLNHDDSPLTRQTLYTSVPPPGSIFTFDDDDDDDDDADDSPSVIPGNRLRQEGEDDDGEDDEDEEEEDRKKKAQQPQRVPLAAVPAVGNSGEDDEAEALAFINNGRPIANRKPGTPTNAPSGGSGTGTNNKKPGAGGKPAATSNESDSEESEEDDVDSNEEEEEDDDSAAARASAQIAANPMSRGRNFVDEDYVSFPPSRSPTLFAVVQGKFPGQISQRRQPTQIISSPNPGNPYQRYVVRVTPANRQPRPPTSSPLYYRPLESRPPPNRRVVPVASFDVSVEDTRPSASSGPVDSEEDGDSISIGGPTPVNSYPFVYKVQGSLQGLRLPSGGPGGPGAQSLAALLGRPSHKQSFAYYGGGFGSAGPSSRPPRPGPPSGYRPNRPPYSISASLYGSPFGSPYGSPYGPQGPSPSYSFGPRRPGSSGGPPIIVRRKQPGGGPNRPPKPHLIAVYNPTGSSSSGPREPVDEEYYTFEVPEHNNKIVSSGGPPKNNKRPTVHRKPTPVIHQKLVSEDEEESEEQSPAPQQVQIIPQGTVRSRRIRGGKQLKPKKNSKKTVSSSSTKKQNQQDQQDPLGLLSKINKSKSKMH